MPRPLGGASGFRSEVSIGHASLKRYRPGRLDAAPPSPPPQQYVYAASDYRARGTAEAELCDKASTVDWLYISGSVAATAGAIALDDLGFQGATQAGIRLLGPPLVGATWGFLIGGAYLALPKCSSDFVQAPPPGESRATWPVAAGLALLSAATAPVIVGIETGQGSNTYAWPVGERIARLFLAGAGGALGALLPYAAPPKTWRAAKQLEKIRAGVTAQGFFVGYSLSF